MSVFFEVKVPTGQGPHEAEIVIARLAEMGFDSFVEEEGSLLAYRRSGSESSEAVLEQVHDAGYPAAAIREIADQNWNAAWEASYDAVSIAGKIRVRAPFHDPEPAMEYNIVIQPKMSFGTAHHETTSLMLEHILEVDLEQKAVLDMGSGTAVLAILAMMRGAAGALAIDNDEWAFGNARENTRLNNVDVEVELGDAGSIGKRRFDIIFANINRNILLRDIPVYIAALEAGGKLIMSGFYETDLPLIKEKCAAGGLDYENHKTANNWVAAVFGKA